MLAGSIGMLPSASLDVDQKGLYEPIHGSAPDIAGQDKANPLATILSLAMMFRYTFARADVADRIEHAVRAVLAQGYRTGDIALPGEKTVGTRAMGDAVVAALRACLMARGAPAIVIRRAERARRRGARARYSAHRARWPERCSCRCRRSRCGASASPIAVAEDYFLVAEVERRRGRQCRAAPGRTRAPTQACRARRHVGARRLAAARASARALLDAVVDLADNWLDYRRLELTVYTDNAAALALYRKLRLRDRGHAARVRLSRRPSTSTRTRWRGCCGRPDHDPRLRLEAGGAKTDAPRRDDAADRNGASRRRRRENADAYRA